MGDSGTRSESCPPPTLPGEFEDSGQGALIGVHGEGGVDHLSACRPGRGSSGRVGHDRGKTMRHHTTRPPGGMEPLEEEGAAEETTREVARRRRILIPRSIIVDEDEIPDPARPRKAGDLVAMDWWAGSR